MVSFQAHVQPVTIGETAHALLSAQTCGQVLTVVSRAAYLLTENGELIWLAWENVPMHRRGFRISAALPGLTVGAPYTIRASHLIFDPQTSLDFSQVPIWVAPAPSSCTPLPIDDLPWRLRTLPSILKGLPPAQGFGVLIPDLLELARSSSASCPEHAFPPSLARAWPHIREIARSCLAHDCHDFAKSAYCLAGLGAGLTPSGDDFIGGVLFCRKILHEMFAELHDLEFPCPAEFFEKIKGSTNIISYTFLKDHAAGFGTETLHHFANAFLTGQPVSVFRPIVSELINFGHSTGWDLLTGFLTGMLLAYDDRPLTIDHKPLPIIQTRKDSHGD